MDGAKEGRCDGEDELEFQELPHNREQISVLLCGRSNFGSRGFSLAGTLREGVATAYTCRKIFERGNVLVADSS